MDAIETRVSFFRLFRQRGYQIYAPEIDRVFDSELATTLFRDSGLKNNSKLVLREPVKQRLDDNGEPIEESEEDEVDGEEGEDEMMEEGGEEEFDEMPEEGEGEMIEDQVEGDEENPDA